jgi:hypothetical protein
MFVSIFILYLILKIYSTCKKCFRSCTHFPTAAGKFSYGLINHFIPSHPALSFYFLIGLDVEERWIEMLNPLWRAAYGFSKAASEL